MAFCTVDDLTTRFTAAADHLPTLLPSIKPEMLLQLYGLYKQSTVGKCNISKPGWYAFEAKQKWDAWNSLGDMPQHAAMEKYVSIITELSPNWESDKDDSGKTTGSVSVSTLGGQESDLDDDEKDLFDRVKDGDVDWVRQCGEDVNSITDDDGLLPLHWAADRGHLDMIDCLIALGAKVNARDKGGQTALHYAAACGHSEVVRLLLKHEADRSIKCMDGLLAIDVAEDDVTKNLIKSSTLT